ncbi:MAG TPA: hypothetical protein VFK06_02985 [Candidatus Angelobacter sp.]|nr:hypothetical protein [Candidatus Angelobacter sp.]
MKTLRIAHLWVAALALLLLGGCTVNTHEKKNASGKNEDVDIRTPLGSLSVHSGDVDVKDTGLPVYPHARPLPHNKNDEDANVNISTPMFGLKVVAVRYESDDPQDKVLSFYRKELGKYGTVVQCTNGTELDFKHEDDNDGPVTCKDSDKGSKNGNIELKTGTRHNQRIVAIEKQGAVTSFNLVYVRIHTGKEKDAI